MTEIFTGEFTQQEPIPEAAIEAAVAVMRSGRLHRYNVAEGEQGHVALLEQEFAASVEASFCLAVASGGYALATALRAREKRALAATRASLAGDAGGDIFAWADTRSSPTSPMRGENPENARDEL